MVNNRANPVDEMWIKKERFYIEDRCDI